jgi:hypothetical protein
MNSARRSALRAIAKDFLEGRTLPLEAALALAGFENEAPDEIRECLTDMVGVASQTDAIQLGQRRQLWHPDVRAAEDQKHDDAQAWAAPLVRATCERLVGAL